MDTEYKLHKGARAAFIIAGVLSILIVITAPLGIWILVRAFRARAVVTAGEVRVKIFLSARFDLADVERVGICKTSAVGGGLLGTWLQMMRAGGSDYVFLCFQNRAGKSSKFLASQFANHQQLMTQIAERAGKPLEKVEMKLLNLRWQEPSVS